MRVMCSSDRPIRARYARRSRAEPACPASTSVISSPSTSRYAWAPMSRTTCTFGRTSITLDARSRSLRQRVLGDALPCNAPRRARRSSADSSGPRVPRDDDLCEPRGCARRGAHGPGGVRPDRCRAVLVSADSWREPSAPRLLSTAWHQTGDLDTDGLHRTRRLPRVTIAFGIWAVPLGPAGGTRLATETRVHATDSAARRRFRLYWFVVGPFSALIRRRWLAAARRAAEAGP